MSNVLIENMNLKNKYLSKYACKDEEATYLEKFIPDIRGNFNHDIDKILYSLSFTRYIDKTQVFSYSSNNHISKRIVHVLYVSKIARTIGRALNLNEDLIEAIALGHDLGHVAFGHVGEKILNDISMENGLGSFNHNIHSVRLLKSIENYGLGLNISLEVLDGIMCHNGEEEINYLKPTKKDKDQFIKEYEESYTNPNKMKKYISGTLEGCVVRISDIIGYIGRDIEDAVRMSLIKKEDLPINVINTLGSTTSQIVNTVILDVIENSINKPYIKISENIFNAIKELKRFNYENIYNKANNPDTINLYREMYNKLFIKYLDDIQNNNQDSKIISSYLKNMSNKYKEENSDKQIVLDYLAGMTDEYIKIEYNKI